MSDYDATEEVEPDFEFEVDTTPDYENDPEAWKFGVRPKIIGTLYRVRMPHQCDEWYIANVKTKAAAVERLEKFIAAAQDALERLKALE